MLFEAQCLLLDNTLLHHARYLRLCGSAIFVCTTYEEAIIAYFQLGSKMNDGMQIAGISCGSDQVTAH